MANLEISGRCYRHETLTLELPVLDPISWIAQQELYPKVYWRERESGLVRIALGKLLESETAAHIESSEARFYGGMRFSPSSAPDELWHRFPRTCFWLPAFEVVIQGAHAHLTMHFIDEPPNPSAMRHLKFEHTAQPSHATQVASRKEMPLFPDWEERIQQLLSQIEMRSVDKVVLARKTELRFEAPLSPWPLLEQLQVKAKRATLFVFQLSADNAFLGATPEKLFERKGRVVHTEALAGTRPRGKTEEEDQALQEALQQSPKEQREFGFVKQFIHTALTPLCEQMQWDAHDRILQTAHVQHLYNHLIVELKDSVTDVDLLHALHPTPALGGFPRKEALAFLAQHECFDRGWYGAPIGWISSEGADIAVAIRSALIHGDALHLFAGTGIVAGSNPEAEWKELDHKIRPFLEIING